MTTAIWNTAMALLNTNSKQIFEIVSQNNIKYYLFTPFEMASNYYLCSFNSTHYHYIISMAQNTGWGNPQPQQPTNWGAGYGQQPNAQQAWGQGVNPAQKLFGGKFTIQSQESGKVIDCCQEEEKKGLAITWDKHGGANQIFKVFPSQNGQGIILQEQKDLLVLGIQASSDSNGSVIIGQVQSHLPSQILNLQETPVNSGVYMIKTFCGKVLDLCESSHWNGTKILQYEVNGGKNQLWRFVPA